MKPIDFIHGTSTLKVPWKYPKELMKPILCLDFDGVIHSYSSKWNGPTEIPDPVVEGFFQWAAKAQEHFLLVIYSSRSKEVNGVDAMRHWLVKEFETNCARQRLRAYADAEGPNHLKLKAEGHAPIHFQFAHEKPAAFLTIDDRVVRFDGQWDDANLEPDLLITYKPWNKR